MCEDREREGDRRGMEREIRKVMMGEGTKGTQVMGDEAY